MAQLGEVEDHLKDPDHVIPQTIWDKIREDAATEAEEAAADGR